VGQTSASCRDASIVSSTPLYAARFHGEGSGGGGGGPRTIYYEVRVLGLGGRDSSLALGYCAAPYPSWRMPGWQRGSLGVHSDDGHRYVNNDCGGKAFTQPFRVGDTVGLGMTFDAAPPPYDPSSSSSGDASGSGSGSGHGKKRLSKLFSKLAMSSSSSSSSGPSRPGMKVDVFFTRNGEREGGWDLHEPRDKYDGAIDGLDGKFDIYPAIGVYGAVQYEVIFDRSRWAYAEIPAS
jgi:hypothetical protein